MGSVAMRTLAQPARAGKHYSLFAVFDRQGKPVKRTRVNHEPGAIRAFLSQFPQGTPVALETVGNWYWIVDQIEAAGCLPHLAHAAKAKMMMGNVHKTDKLDADGLATLLHNGTLPSVWIAPGSLRDERELPRTRMAFSKMRTALTSSRCPSGRTACIPPWPHLPWRAVPGSMRSP
jgi:hypothetical protein